MGSIERRCDDAMSKSQMCEELEFQLNCPKTCKTLCNSNGQRTNEVVQLTNNLDDARALTVTRDGTSCTGKAPYCCNGLTNTCNLRVDEMLFAAMHNANNDESHWNSNHQAPLEGALEKGFRAFYLDVCICNNKLVFCHSRCLWAGTQDPVEVFENIITFLKANPSELVIFNFEMAHGDPTPSQLWDVMQGVQGMKLRSYIHSGGAWPEIGTLLQNHKQIISLKHNGINCLNTNNAGCTPYIQEFFKYTLGTKYHFHDISEIEDVRYSCVGERGTYYEKRFYAINGFVTNNFPGPSLESAKTLNQKKFVKKRISNCQGLMNKNANFYAVDFWQQGNVPLAVKHINAARGKTKWDELYGSSATVSNSTFQRNDSFFVYIF